jgi:hypothetical protein
MIYETIKRHALILALLPVLTMTGCINASTTPGYARAGDLVNIGLGGVKRNTDGTDLWGGPSANDAAAANISAVITDDFDPDDGDPGTYTYDLQVRGTFRAFPDYSSQYSVSALDRSDAYFSNMDPYDGQWWVTIELVDAGGTPLPLTPNQQHRIIVSSSELTDQTWSYEGELTNFHILILDGVATPTNEEKQQYKAYRSRPNLTIKPDLAPTVNSVGGLQVKVDYDPTFTTYSVLPRLVPISHDPNITVIQHTVDNGDGTHGLIAMVVNPNGFVDLDGGLWEVGSSTFDDLSFAVVVSETYNYDLNEYPWQNNYTLDSAESFYIDNNGDVIGSMTPVLGRSY